MIAAGMVHAVWLTDLPTLSYGAALVIDIAITVVGVTSKFFGALYEEVQKS
jgi:hypothetical protein